MNASPTCRDGTDRLMEYMEGVLDDSLKRMIDEHLAACARCTAFVRSYAAISSIMRTATSATLPPAGQDALRRALAARRR